jgi:RluA family pseudouridine synthase
MLSRVVEIQVAANDAEQRLDRFLRKLWPNATLGLIQRLVRKGAIRGDGQKLSGSDRLVAGMTLRFDLEDARFAELRGSSAQRAEPRRARPGRGIGTLDVLWSDQDIAFADKPGGLAVHGGTGIGDDHLAARLDSLAGQRSLTFRPAPANRIDRGTSGIVAIGLSARGLRGLTEAFRERRVEKTYLAWVEGRVADDAGSIELPLDVRDRGADRPKAAAGGEGQTAVTRFRVLARGDRTTLCAIDLETGRTHQIRAHLGALGHPLLGDTRYGARPVRALGPHRFALHAWRLSLRHPTTGETLSVEAPCPRDLRELQPGLPDESDRR